MDALTVFVQQRWESWHDRRGSHCHCQHWSPTVHRGANSNLSDFPSHVFWARQKLSLCLNLRCKSSSTGTHGPKVQVWGASATWCWGACQGKGATETGGWEVRKNLSTNILFVFGLSQVLFYSFRQDMLCPPAWASSLKERVLKAGWGSFFTFITGLKIDKQKKTYSGLITNNWSRHLVNFLHD